MGAAWRADPDLTRAIERLAFREQVDDVVGARQSLLHIREVFNLYEQEKVVARVVRVLMECALISW